MNREREEEELEETKRKIDHIRIYSCTCMFMYICIYAKYREKETK